MTDYSTNNKRIAKNTLILYFRMLVIMVVTLYTTRVVLKVLGASDYGIYDVVGGVIGMLGYFNTILSGGVARFLTIAIGKGEESKAKETFALCNTIALIGAISVLVLGETLGLWFVETQLNIPPDRYMAAFWVYQSAVASAILTLLQMPYSAAIIAHEDMSVYGYMTVIDAILKLAIVYLLIVSSLDNLVLYGFLLFAVNAIGVVIYRLYCVVKYKETTVKILYKKKELLEMLSYSGWTTIGAFAGVLNNYGITVLLNIFFGTLVNAARGVAAQINIAVHKVYSVFQTATKPQIFKYYSKGDIESMSVLIRNASKYSAYLTIMIIVPLGIHLDGVLCLWLGDDYPDYTVSFTRCMMIQSLFLAIDLPVGTGIQAVGKMKLPNLTTSFLYLLVFPLTYIAFLIGASPIVGYLVFISCSPFILIVDLLILRKYTGFSIQNYIRDVVSAVSKIFVLVLLFPCLLESISISCNIWIATLLKLLLSFIYVLLIVFYFGITPKLREQILTKIRQHVK